MKTLIRRISRKSTKKFEYSWGVPAEIVRALKLEDASVKVQVHGKKIILEKLMENDSSDKIKINNDKENFEDDGIVRH